MKSVDSEILLSLGKILYNLHHTHDLESSEYFNTLYQRLQFDSTGQDIEWSIKALKWAMENKDYNFNDILPNIRFSNDYIFRFLVKYLSMLDSAFDEKTIVAMRTPLDERKLRILLVDNWLAGELGSKLANTTYYTARTSEIGSAISKYSKESFDIVILCLKSQKDNFEFLASFQETKQKKSRNEVPILALLDHKNNMDIGKLYELGCNKHLFLPVPRHLLLQEIYQLTT